MQNDLRLYKKGDSFECVYYIRKDNFCLLTDLYKIGKYY